MTKELHSIAVRLAAPMTEFDFTFVQGMADRMAVSFHKYGPIADGFPDKVNAMLSMQQRVDEYNATGNLEHLIDAANFLMIEFILPAHPSAHFASMDSDGSPGRTMHTGEVTVARNKDI